MSKLEMIKAPVASDMKQFGKYFKTLMRSDVYLLRMVTNYMLKRKGKQMRPLFVFLTAKMLGTVNESTQHAAALIELMHTATLVHDDVVDESYKRRGFFSINALWKNKISVLIGDYLLSRGLLLSIKHKEFDLLSIVSDAVREMAEGELLQLEKARHLNTEEDIYFEIIRKKTATLLAACVASGAKSAGATNEQVEQLRQFGEHIGIAFQIKDDLFDYQINNLTGKPSGNDIQEKKMTLPLIYTFNNSDNSQKRKIKHIINKHNQNLNEIKELINIVKLSGGIEYAKEKMNQYKDKAVEILNQFEDCQAKNSLIELANYTIERKK